MEAGNVEVGGEGIGRRRADSLQAVEHTELERRDHTQYKPKPWMIAQTGADGGGL